MKAFSKLSAIVVAALMVVAMTVALTTFAVEPPTLAQATAFSNVATGANVTDFVATWINGSQDDFAVSFKVSINDGYYGKVDGAMMSYDEPGVPTVVYTPDGGVAVTLTPSAEGVYSIAKFDADDRLEVKDVKALPVPENESAGFSAIAIDSFNAKDGGVYDLAFDVEILSGFQLVDKDLHDGYVPVRPTVVVKTLNANGSISETKIAPSTSGEKAGHYVVKNFDPAKQSIAVRDVESTVRTIDGIAKEDFVIERDGRTYTFKGAATYGKVTFLSAMNDWTKVNLDGCAVAEDGKILVPDATALKSYAPAVVFSGKFANYGTLSFANQTGIDAPNQNATISLTTGEFYNYGTINSAWNNVTITTKGFFNDAKAVINVNSEVRIDGEKASMLTIALTNFKNYNLLNDGTINVGHQGNLLVNGNLVNNGKIETCGTVMIARALTNGKTGDIHLFSEAWVDAVTGERYFGYTDALHTAADTHYLPARACGVLHLVATNIGEATTTKNTYINHTNKGKIWYDGDYIARNNYFFVNMANFNNSGIVSFKTTYSCGQGVEGGGWDTYYPQALNTGVITNDGTFEIVGMKFNLINAPYFKAPLGGSYSTSIFQSIDKNSFYHYDSIWGDKMGKVSGDFSFAQNNGTPMFVRPVEIINNATMILADLSNAGVIENYGDLTVNGLAQGYTPRDGLYKSVATMDDIYAYDDCAKCVGHKGRVTAIRWTSEFYNFGTFNNVGESRFVYAENEGTINNTGILLNGQLSNGKDNGKGTYDDSGNAIDWTFINYGKINNPGSIINYGDFENEKEITSDGIFTNLDWFIIRKGATLTNNGTFNNGTTTMKNGDVIDDDTAWVDVVGKFVNNGKINNYIGSDIRVEGELDTTLGTILNRGELVNAGKILATEGCITNEYAIHGLAIEYVKAADEETKAADEETKAPETTKAEETTKAAETTTTKTTPAAATSDVAVAGFAMVAALALAGVVVAKKVR